MPIRKSLFAPVTAASVLTVLVAAMALHPLAASRAPLAPEPTAAAQEAPRWRVPVQSAVLAATPILLEVAPLEPESRLPAVPRPAVPPAYRLVIPVEGLQHSDLIDSFADPRGTERRHLAIDLLAPVGTRVLAAASGRIVRMHNSARGGITLYMLDAEGGYVYYYAHLDAYADGIRPGMWVERGQHIGYVGHTGNAHEDVPHLHFAIWQQRPGGSGWGGRPVNPYRALVR